MASHDADKEDFFSQVLSFPQENPLSWEEVQEKVPMFPRGWFELSKLNQEDRVEFTHSYWIAMLPFWGARGVEQEEKIDAFFDCVESIDLFATQMSKNASFEVHMTYTLKNEMGFFQGGPPATIGQQETLCRQFSQFALPPDYLAFLQIHDGFSKYTDMGLIPIKEMAQRYQKLQKILHEHTLVRPDGEIINASHLIPFYESYGLHAYQCFYADWYPEEEMGNLFFSEYDLSMSNFLDAQRAKQNKAFSTFLDWLAHYVEDLS